MFSMDIYYFIHEYFIVYKRDIIYFGLHKEEFLDELESR